MKKIEKFHLAHHNLEYWLSLDEYLNADHNLIISQNFYGMPFRSPFYLQVIVVNYSLHDHQCPSFSINEIQVANLWGFKRNVCS